ncbi:MAG: type III-B CRISPR-associated protein Cas10/Cmr2 [Candidatus Electrothrix aestuarii]|uniref:Type III-B CRISPR-associated protein Cas10/Cmr2 n=1 Tax=Candidatus Electrothrix aestuarii TaxID=3062594 RepID=A0AAU8LY92_9BACT|nr:type III-B CRISPR-associated protein Cas10/Cmr2 [Candidatus Electrothrix aestuarii]
MSDQETWLISLSIGPVQDFISAALRTRDLWFGSHMLSEVSKAAAIAINNYQGAKTELIFPDAENSDELKPLEVNVANRIVAKVWGDKNIVKDIIKTGKQDAQDKLKDFISTAKGRAEKKYGVSLRDKDTDDIWSSQADPKDLLDLYGTAARITEQGDKGYQEAKERLDRTSTARKNSRNFSQSAEEPNDKPFYGLPKSSLDGRRETVLEKIDDKEKDKRIRRRLRMGKGEQLDAMGLVKRLAGENPDQFTPTTRIAIDPWIRKIKEAENGQHDLEKIRAKLKTHADALLRAGLMTHVKGNKRKDELEGIYQDVPFDAGLLYQGVLDEAIRKIREEKSSNELEILKKLRNKLVSIWKNHGKPCPYYAMLLADGDNMGRLIKAAQSDTHHKKISECLSDFARSVPETARKEAYRAHCIYAGGDDVLLMAPLDTVLLLADELRKAFTTTLKDVADDLKQEPPTFSVGIVIAHMQTPIGRVRRLVSKAEKLAKDGFKETDDPRNALAIIVDPRSGAEMSFRAKWERDPAQKQDGDELNEQKSSVEELNALAKLYRDDKLPSGFGYELRQIEQLVHDMEENEQAQKIAELEMQRILNRKNQSGGGEKVDGDTIKDVIAHAQQKQENNNEIFDIESVYKEHLIARWLGAHGEERG